MEDRLSKLDFGNMSRGNPVVVHNNTFFLVEFDVSGGGHRGKLTTLSSKISRDLELVESITVREFEQTYLRNNETPIKNVIQQEWANQKSSLEQKVQVSSFNSFEVRERLPIIEFIYDQIFPLHLDEVVIDTTRKKVDGPGFGPMSKQLGSFFASQSFSDPFQRVLHGSSLLQEVLGSIQPVMFYQDIAYRLTGDNNVQAYQELQVPELFRTNRRVIFRKQQKEIENQYINSLIGRIKKLCSEDETFSEIQRNLERRSDLASIVMLDDYSIKGIGFKVHEGEYYVTLRVPEFALRDREGNHYGFGACTICVKLETNNGKVPDWDTPIVWESYHHPFLSSSKVEKHPICLASDKTPSEIKEQILRHVKSINSQIYIVLNIASTTLQRGYFAKGAPYGGGLSPHDYSEELSNYKRNPRKYPVRL